LNSFVKKIRKKGEKEKGKKIRKVFFVVGFSFFLENDKIK